MSVFTPVPESVLADWLKDYAIGRLVELKGISAGVQNSNFFVTTTLGRYVLTLFASVWLLKRVDEPGLRALIALMPVPAIGLALRAIVRYIRDADEMQQRIELEAVSFATAFVSMLYIAGGFLQLAGVIDIPSAVAMIWVFPLVCFSYGLAKIVVGRRYL